MNKTYTIKQLKIKDEVSRQYKSYMKRFGQK